MAENSDVRADLLQRIWSRRAGLQAYVEQNRPRFRRRANVTIVLSTLAALSTAGPAVGGESFAGGVQRALGLSSDSYVWRVLCLAALLVSVGAAILTNLAKSPDQAARLASAEAVDGELEGLSVLLEFGQLAVQDAVKLYQQYTAKISFVPDAPMAPDSGPAAVVAPAVASVPASAPADRARRGGGLPAVPPPVRPRSTMPPVPRPPSDRTPPR
jgi:hypothetical protein